MGFDFDPLAATGTHRQNHTSRLTEVRANWVGIEFIGENAPRCAGSVAT